jgi:hypothetical protein
MLTTLPRELAKKQKKQKKNIGSSMVGKNVMDA